MQHIAVVIILQSQLQCQRTQCVWRFHNMTIVVNIGGIGNENGPNRSKLCRDSATLKHMFKRIKQELRSQPSRTSVEAVRHPIGTWSGILLGGHPFIKFMFVNFLL